MEESKLHDLIINNKGVQKDICELIGVDYKDIDYVHEDKYINEITADFTIKSDNVVLGIMECKGDNIGVTDYVRGIGQIMQYGYFAEEGLSNKGYEFSPNVKIIYCFPSALIRNALFNIGLFKYPENCVIIEVHEITHAVRQITPKMLKELATSRTNNLVTISQYYVRDNRLYELYILLKHLTYLKLQGKTFVNRVQLEKDFLINIGSHNNGNWRNAYISLSSLGFINSNNLPTTVGVLYSAKSFEEFAYDLFDVYLKPYFEEIYIALESANGNTVSMKNKEISEKIRERFQGRDVLFLTESSDRYISSWMNIMRDDYGCVSFSKASALRVLNYNPCKFNKVSLMNEIKNHSVAYQYIDKYHKLLNTERE